MLIDFLLLLLLWLLLAVAEIERVGNVIRNGFP